MRGDLQLSYRLWLKPMKLASLQMESFLLGKLLGLVELGLVFSSKIFLFLEKKKAIRASSRSW